MNTRSNRSRGAFRELLTVHKPEQTSDGAGGLTTTYIVAFTLWASIDPAAPAEAELGRGMQQAGRFKVTIDVFHDVVRGDLLSAGALVLQVDTVTQSLSQSRYAILYCSSDALVRNKLSGAA